MQGATLIHTHARKHHVYMSCGTQRWSRDLLCCDWPSILAGTAHAWKKPGGESDRFDTGMRASVALLLGGFQVGAYGIGVKSCYGRFWAIFRLVDDLTACRKYP